MKYTREEARRKVLNCAKEYREKLLKQVWNSLIKQVMCYGISH